MDRVYIGRTFCVVVLAGLGSMTGTLAAGLILGIAESIVLMMPRRLVGAGGRFRPAAGGARRAAAGTVLADEILGRRRGAARSSRSSRRSPRDRTSISSSPRFVVLQFVVLATAWNILGGYAGYVNFGTAGLLRHRRLHRGGALQVARRAARGADRRRAAVIGGAARLRRRPADAAPARHLLRHRHRGGRSFIMETVMINWRYVGGATGLQLLRPDGDRALRQLHAHAVRRHGAARGRSPCRWRATSQTSWIGRGLRAIRDSEEAAECSRRADAQAEALRLHRLRRADGRGRRADADVPHASSSRPRPSA